MEAVAGERWVPDPSTRAALAAIGLRLEAPASTAELVQRPEVEADRLAAVSPTLRGLAPEDLRVVAETLRYSGYLARQEREAERVVRAGAHPIPDAFVYRGLPGLSHELVEKLERVRPDTLGRASRIDGMTPAALALLAGHLERAHRPSKSGAA
jgi:tRNA uridine 5-carboxymethylaminomethyl modification enzyme